MLLVYSLIFYLLSLLLDFTRNLPQTKTVQNIFSTEHLESKFDKEMHFVGFFNEIFGHMISYFIVCAFARKCLHVFLLVDISHELRQSSYSFEDLFDKLEEIEREEFVRRDVQDDDDAGQIGTDDFDDNDFGTNNRFQKSPDSHSTASGNPRARQSLRQKAYSTTSNFGGNNQI